MVRACASLKLTVRKTPLFDCSCPPPHLLLDELPDDPGHLISVHLHHGLGHLDAFVGICQSHRRVQSCRLAFNDSQTLTQTAVKHIALPWEQ